jgi:hypothetical protein
LLERQIPVLISQTSRTLAEHNDNLANGSSRVGRSKHLPRRLRGLIVGSAEDDKADAIDIVPFELYQLHGPDKLAWVERATPESIAAFKAIGEIGESLGLRWGGRWTDPHDPGHLEFLLPGERYRDIPQSSAAFEAHGVHA